MPTMMPLSAAGPLHGDRENAERQWLLTAALRPDWVRIYQESMYEPWRVPVLEALKQLAPYGTVLDLGCNCGALMPCILTASPSAEVFGIDLGEVAITAAKTLWPGHAWLCGSVVDWLPVLQKRFDVCTSGSTLCGVPPSCIEGVLDNVARLCSAVVLQEPCITTMLGPGQITTSAIPEWRHDWEAQMARRGFELLSKHYQSVGTSRPVAVMAFVSQGAVRV